MAIQYGNYEKFCSSVRTKSLQCLVESRPSPLLVVARFDITMPFKSRLVLEAHSIRERERERERERLKEKIEKKERNEKEKSFERLCVTNLANIVPCHQAQLSMYAKLMCKFLFATNNFQILTERIILK